MTRRGHSRIFVYCVSILMISAIARTGYAADKWLSVRSRNFLLVGDAPENQIRRVGRNLEQFREAFSLVFPGIRKLTTAGTTVVVFRNDDSFKPYKPAVDGKTVNADAYFDGGEDGNFIAVTGNPNAQFLVLHEYVHALMKDVAGGVPVWVNEGLAEYYSSFAVGDNDREFIIGRPIARHLEVLRANTLIPLETLFTINHESPYYNEAEKQGVFYAQSWALVHYLLNAKNRTLVPQFSRFISLLHTDKPVDESFKEAFQSDYSAMERELRDYIRGRSLNETKLLLEQGFAVEKEMTVSAVSEAQSEYYLGTLLYHIQRMSDAEAHLSKAISLDAKLGSAYASLGMMRAEQKQFTEALSLLKRAVAADSPSHLVHFMYADVLDVLDREDALPDEDYATKEDTMREQLRRSIDLNPAFLESYRLLAQLNLASSEQLPETEAMLNTALSMAPGRQDLALLLAQTLLRLQKVEPARALLTPIARGGADDSLRRQANLILQNLDLYSGDRDAIRESLARREIIANRTEPANPPASTPQPTPATPRASTPQQPRGREPVIEVLTPVAARPQGEQITGLLTMLDCSEGLTLRIVTDTETADLHTNMPQNIEFVSYVPDVSATVTCGPRDPAAPVTVTYNKETREPLVVEFVEFLEKK